MMRGEGPYLWIVLCLTALLGSERLLRGVGAVIGAVLTLGYRKRFYGAAVTGFLHLIVEVWVSALVVAEAVSWTMMYY
jgi:hypothetical protein